jgi:antitoxin YefM
MDAISYTAARTNLAKTMEQFCEAHSPMIITRNKAQSVVMISLEDYKAQQETVYLLGAPKNARRLLESVTELEQGGVERKRNFLNETGLLQERLDRLSVLAKNR